MKNFFFILLGAFFLFFSCKSGKIDSSNNTFYDTSSKVGLLTTDLPKYSPLPLVHENSQKDTVRIKNKVNSKSSVKKTQQKKEVPAPVTIPHNNDDSDDDGDYKELAKDSLKIIAYEKILSEKINLINSEKKNYLLAKAEVEKNSKNKSALHIFSQSKKNLETTILEKKVTEDLLNKLKIKYKGTLENSSAIANVEKNKVFNVKSPKETRILPEKTSNSNENKNTENIVSSPAPAERTDAQEITEANSNDINSAENSISSSVPEVRADVQEITEGNSNDINSAEDIILSPVPTEHLVSQEVEEVTNNTVIRSLNVKDFSWEVGIKLTQILDVRSLDDFKQGHIFDAINIDINSPHFKIQILSLDKSRPIAVYSQDGVQSLNAAKILQEADFSIIFNLEGGLNKWIENGKEIIK